MSVHIKQSPPEAGSPKEGKCSPMVVSRAEDMNNAFKEKLNEALAERDDMWRKHEKEQVAYLQGQNSQMLSRLHTEIERLQNVNRDLERRLYVSTEPETFDEIRAELLQAQQASEKYKKELANAETRSRLLAQTLEESAKIYKDQVTDHEARIRQLTSELNQKTLTITQLSTQLRNFKLREAMAQAQQRRRASCIEPSKNTGFRLFAGSSSSNSNTLPRKINVDVPGSGSVLKQNATVSVSYPNQTSSTRRLPFINRVPMENSIEKPAVTRSVSVGIPPTKPHLIHALRQSSGDAV